MPRTEPTPAPAPTPGQLIRAARDRLGWSQRQLAERLGLRQTTVSALERDVPGTLRLQQLLSLAAQLGIEPDRIDPSLRGIVATAERLARGRVSLVRCAGEDQLWTAEGSGIEGTQVVHDLGLGTLIRSLVERGIEVTAPALPPVE